MFIIIRGEHNGQRVAAGLQGGWSLTRSVLGLGIGDFLSVAVDDLKCKKKL